MSDEAILFFAIIMSIVFLYRMILSILFLLKKKYLLDEKFYISIFYYSLVGILVLFTNWIIAGIILCALLPVILTLYISFAPTRIYWIVNGFNLTEATFINELIAHDSRLENAAYRTNKIRFIKKKSESKIKMEFIKVNYEEKTILLKIVLKLLKEKVVKTNKREVSTFLLYFCLLLFMIFLILLTLFT